MQASIEKSPLAIYTEYLERGVLAYQYSPAADRAVFFPRAVCPYTGSATLEWRVSRGEGTIYAITEISPKNGDPYHVALVDMEEGFRLMSNVIATPGRAPGIGMRVAVRIAPLGENGTPCPVFDLRDTQ